MLVHDLSDEDGSNLLKVSKEPSIEPLTMQSPSKDSNSQALLHKVYLTLGQVCAVFIFPP